MLAMEASAPPCVGTRLVWGTFPSYHSPLFPSYSVQLLPPSETGHATRGRARNGLNSPGHAATGRNSAKTLVRDDRRSQDFTQGTLSL